MTTPHFPSHDFTRDGRLGFLRRVGFGGKCLFYILKPEGQLAYYSRSDDTGSRYSDSRKALPKVWAKAS